jgi:sec-independent protein translocase protein TatC
MEHLGELRKRILISLLIVAVAAGAAYFFINELMRLMLWPLQRSHPEMGLVPLAPTETLFVFVRVALLAGVIAASPFVIQQLWLFIAPALQPAERRRVSVVLPLVMLLFAAGVAFVYLLLLPVSLQFLIALGGPDLTPMYRLETYVHFVSSLCLAGGLLFELPVVLGVCGWLGLVTPAFLWKHIAHATVLLMVVAAVITPTGDALTMLIFTAPLLLLYLFSILVVAFVRRRGAPETAAARSSPAPD